MTSRPFVRSLPRDAARLDQSRLENSSAGASPATEPVGQLALGSVDPLGADRLPQQRHRLFLEGTDVLGAGPLRPGLVVSEQLERAFHDEFALTEGM